MAKRVILTLMEGSFEQGFPVILRIKEDSAPAETEIQGKLPPGPDVLEAFNKWQLVYRQLVMPNSRIKPKLAQVTNFSCPQLGLELEKRLNNWLNSGIRDWQKIRDGLQRNLVETEEIRVIIQTEDIRLRRLPWHSWDLFSNHYTKAEIALSAPEYKPQGSTASRNNKVRILAILGDSTDIDVQKDRAILEQLPNAEPPTFLVEPQCQELNDQLWDKQWQILFFAGHSSSEMDGNTGKIYINSTDSLSIADLKNALRRAISHGLQLAIFNSCDGLGLARELADLHIPQIIVMREPVPDVVAQEFLKHFLTSFAKGKSLYLAVREARERLQGRENLFSFASWLPIICQNPAELPLTWHSLRHGTVSDRNRIIQWLYKPLLLVLTSLIWAWTINTLRTTVLDNSSTTTLCYGRSCINRDPADNKCRIRDEPKNYQTITSTPADFLTSKGSIENFKIQLKYSERCNSTWVEIAGEKYIANIPGSIVYIEDNQGIKYGKSSVPKVHPYREYYNDMGAGKSGIFFNLFTSEIRACVQTPQNELKCTNFVKP
ncbi:CHAT domain-containing protein [Coleofasciculus sp. H7-2]|uniref:CHAT domain-containing protein n=1 Tax=Coleofasciculus sp. H7-2 TaxID=3351545 RepID=UPI00366D4416